MGSEQWIWCPDGRHRKCRVERMKCPSAYGVRWWYLCSYYNGPSDWNVWVTQDRADTGPGLRCPTY